MIRFLLKGYQTLSSWKDKGFDVCLWMGVSVNHNQVISNKNTVLFNQNVSFII